jgi:hypothetical protein
MKPDFDEPLPLKALAQLEDSMRARLDALETDNRQLRKSSRIMVIALMVTVGLALASIIASGSLLATRNTSVVSAREFVLKDERGVVRGGWSIRNDGSTRLLLADRTGVPRLHFTILEGGSPGMVFVDGRGAPRVVLGVQPDETNSLTFADRTGNARAVLGLSRENEVSLVLADARGATRAAFGVDLTGEPSLTLARGESGDTAIEPEPATAPPSN